MKPENIFITADIKAKVGDFGMSVISENYCYKHRIQSSESQIYEKDNLSIMPNFNNHCTETTGTLQYMAPESLSKSNYSTHSDIYSFGIIMWEFIMEKEAYEGLEGFGLINSIVTENRRPYIEKKIDDYVYY